MSEATSGHARGSVLCLAFGTTVAMWAVGYTTHLPMWAGPLPGWVSGLAFVVCLIGGGYVAGRLEGCPRVGLVTGLFAALLNLLILGSVLAEGAAPNPAIFVPGWLGLGAALGYLGGRLGARTPRAGATNWGGAMAWVTLAATTLLIGAGGLVTSHDAGLAVPDWPNTYTSNMFLYPLSRMTGGIYYEHAHRLFGALVGLTTIALCVQVFRTRQPGWVRALAALAVPMVVAQGIMGGLRVTGGFTTSTDASQLNPMIGLAIAHGVFAQVFYATLAAIACGSATSWRRPGPRPADVAAPSAATPLLFVGLVLTQLVLGALLRHLDWGLAYHMTLALGVALVGLYVGVRAWSLAEWAPTLGRLGAALSVLVTSQLVLGVGAFLLTRWRPGGVWEAPVATLHQTTGAVILATAVSVVVFTVGAGLRAPSPAESAEREEREAVAV